MAQFPCRASVFLPDFRLGSVPVTGGGVRACCVVRVAWFVLRGPQRATEHENGGKCPGVNAAKPRSGKSLKLLDEFFHRQTRLFDDAFERAGLERFVLRHDNRAVVFAKNKVRAGLTELDEAETFQGANCFNAVDVTGNLHATARIGSWEKCRRMRLGRCFGSK